MMINSPIAAAQAGQASGGGLLDSLTGASAAGSPSQSSSGDGSVGLFDGVLGKALLGGAAGAALGAILPFGGPILGGISGALSGVAMGMFSNFRKMSAIKQENQAMLAQLGVQTGSPDVQQVLESGNVEQLVPMMEQAMPVQQAPSAAVDQSTNPNQSPVPVQAATGSGALDPTAVDPGLAPSSSGGGEIDTLAVDSSGLDSQQLAAKIAQLQVQIDQLKAFLEEEERREERERRAAAA